MIEIPPISLRGGSSKESEVGDQRSPEGFAEKSGLSVPEGQVLIANFESEARNEDSSLSFMSWQSTIHNTQWEISCIRLRSAFCSVFYAPCPVAGSGAAPEEDCASGLFGGRYCFG